MAAEILHFGFASPEYGAVWRERAEHLRRIRANPRTLPQLRQFYRDNPARFICHWGCVQVPRDVALGLPTTIPFGLWPRQHELIAWILSRWKRGENGCVAKLRNSDVTWLTTAFACTLCIFYPGIVVRVACRKVEYCDSTPNSLIAKARVFLRGVPPEFLGGFDLEKSAPITRVLLPNGSAMTAEAGAQIGHSDRTSLSIIDEAAFLEAPEVADAALSQTTPCRIVVSTPHGRTGSFADKFFSGKVPTFVLGGRHCSMKNQAWQDQQVATLPPHVLAAESELSPRVSRSRQAVTAPEFSPNP